MIEAHKLALRSLGLTCALAITVGGLVGCAPEPTVVAGQTEKGSEAANPESSWGSPTEDFDAEAKTTELPATFPKEQFPLPQTAVIDDAGERGETAWFVVLRATDEAEAESLWSEVISLGGFVEGEVTETTEGGKAATLTSATLSVTAVTIPQQNGTVLVSYDLSQNAV